MGSYRHILIESGPILDTCRAMQAEHCAALKVADDFAKTLGSNSIFTNGNSLFPSRAKVIGLGIVTPLPKGWKLDRRRRFMEPYAKAKDIQAQLAALPDFPDTRTTISDLLGWDPNVVEQGEDGQTVKSYAVPYAQLAWSHDQFCAVIPLHDLFGETNADTIAKAMALPLPDGCREISAAEWELIKAQAEVAAKDAQKQPH